MYSKNLRTTVNYISAKITKQQQQQEQKTKQNASTRTYLSMHSNHLRGYNHLNYISFSIFVIYLIGSFRFLWVTIKLFIRCSRLQNISGPFFPPKCLSWTFRSIRFLKVKIQVTLAVLFQILQEFVVRL